MTKIREAEEYDTLSILSLMESFSAASGSPFVFIDQEKSTDLIESLLEADDSVVFLAENDDGPVGFIVGAIGELLFNRVRYCTELAWFIEPEYRGGTTAIRLLRAYEDWGRSKKVRFVNISDMSAVQENGSMYERLGYTKTETAYVKDLEVS